MIYKQFIDHCKEMKYIQTCMTMYMHTGADAEVFQKGGGVEGENFERKMFVDTCINACTHKNYRHICNSLSLQEDSFLFFALFYYSLLFFERGVRCNPRNPPSRYTNGTGCR